MVYWFKANISTHQRYYSNPLNTTHPIWELKLVEWSYKNSKRVSMRGKYQPIRMKFHNIGSSRDKRNPVTWILESKEERKVFGKFNR